MFETPITVVGRIVTDPKRRSVGPQDVVKFRMASNARRRTDAGEWEPGDSLFVNVNCWGRLVTGVAASLKKGDAVIVVGNIHTSEYEDRDGVRRSSLELRATAVGPDLSRYVVKIEKVVDNAQSASLPTGVSGPDPVGARSAEVDGGDVSGDGLQLTA